MYFQEKSYCWKSGKKSGTFSNSIFEPYRDSELLRLDAFKTYLALLQSLLCHPWKFHMFLYTHFRDPIWTKLKSKERSFLFNMCSEKPTRFRDINERIF